MRPRASRARARCDARSPKPEAWSLEPGARHLTLPSLRLSVLASLPPHRLPAELSRTVDEIDEKLVARQRATESAAARKKKRNRGAAVETPPEPFAAAPAEEEAEEEAEEDGEEEAEADGEEEEEEEQQQQQQ